MWVVTPGRGACPRGLARRRRRDAVPIGLCPCGLRFAGSRRADERRNPPVRCLAVRSSEPPHAPLSCASMERRRVDRELAPVRSRRERRGPSPVRTIRCLGCGHAVQTSLTESSACLSGGYVSACPSCGADFYTRPPRSYAELEGFSQDDPAAGPRSWVARLVRRALIGVYRPLLGPVYRTLVRGPTDRMMLRETATPAVRNRSAVSPRHPAHSRTVRSR